MIWHCRRACDFCWVIFSFADVFKLTSTVFYNKFVLCSLRSPAKFQDLSRKLRLLWIFAKIWANKVKSSYLKFQKWTMYDTSDYSDTLYLCPLLLLLSATSTTWMRINTNGMRHFIMYTHTQIRSKYNQHSLYWNPSYSFSAHRYCELVVLLLTTFSRICVRFHGKSNAFLLRRAMHIVVVGRYILIGFSIYGIDRWPKESIKSMRF